MESPRFVSGLTPTAELTSALWFIFAENDLLVQVQDNTAVVPRLTDLNALPNIAPHLLRQHYMGHVAGDTAVHCVAAEVSAVAAPPGMAFAGLRQLYRRLPDDQLWLAARAIQIIDWDRTHQFCSRCGTAVAPDNRERVKRCARCGHTMYPRLAPAMIVRVTRETAVGREILLARGHHYPPGWYSVLAGFVEPGETLEECVRREIEEEVGIAVQNIRYFGSQPWPFPHSLMVAFTADYAAGDIVLGEDEIADARWFSATDLPRIPPRMSIARQLIDDFAELEGDK